MANSVAQAYLAKLMMVIEYESVMSDSNRAKSEYFPKYVIKCEIIQGETFSRRQA